MSRDSHVTSAYQPRVSSFGLPLNQIDSLTLNSANMMPQPPSAMKRKGPNRQSMIPASARASMIPSSRQSLLPSSNPRPSLLPSGNSRQSIVSGGRPSLAMQNPHSIVASRAVPYSRNTPAKGPSVGEMMAASVQRANMRKSVVPGQK